MKQFYVKLKKNFFLDHQRPNQIRKLKRKKFKNENQLAPMRALNGAGTGANCPNDKA